MKIACSFALLATLMIVAAFPATEAKAATTPDILLLIDDSDPAAITITATSNDPLLGDTGDIFGAGFILDGFFSAETPAAEVTYPLSSTSLTTAFDRTPFYDRVYPNTQTQQLQIFDQSDPQGHTEDFFTNTPAFQGSAETDLSLDALTLPTPGTLGAVLLEQPSASGGEEFNQLGSYMVVPEPCPKCLILAAAVAAIAWCRGGKRARQEGVAS